MICVGCRKGFHEGCRGGTWCDCQHRTPVRESAARIIEQDWQLLDGLRAMDELTAMAREDGLGDHERPEL